MCVTVLFSVATWCLTVGLLMLSFGSGAAGLQWESVPGPGVRVCRGDTAHFNWSLLLLQPNSSDMDSIILSFTSFKGPVASNNKGGGLMAQSTGRYAGRVSSLGNAGFSLANVTDSDASMYLAEAFNSTDSITDRITNSTRLIVKDIFRARMEARLLPEPTWDPVLQIWTLQLSCTVFQPNVSKPNFMPEWVTPTGQVLNSTSYSEGKFYVSLRPPLTEGQYACRVPPEVVEEICAGDDVLSVDGSLKAVVTVDDVNMRLSVLEAQQERLALQLDDLDQQLTNVSDSFHGDIHTRLDTLEGLVCPAGAAAAGGNCTGNSILDLKDQVENEVLPRLNASVSELELVREVNEILLQQVANLTDRLSLLEVTLPSLLRLNASLEELARIKEQNRVLSADNLVLRDDVQNLKNHLASLEESLQVPTAPVQTTPAPGSNSSQSTAPLQDLRRADVGFNADCGHLPYRNYNFNPSGPVVFDRVLSNVGQGYDKVSGIFTAPVNGLYAFFLHFMAGTHDGSTDLSITTKGQALSVAFAEGYNKDNNDKGSCTAVVYLVKGQQVSVRLHYGIPQIWGSPLASFSGFLVG